MCLVSHEGFPGGSVVKISLSVQETWFVPGWGRSPRRRKWQPIPGCLPGKSHGQKRSPGGYSLMGLQEVDPSGLRLGLVLGLGLNLHLGSHN